MSRSEPTLTPEEAADLISIEEAAKVLPRARPGRSRCYSTIYRWIESGKLRAWKLGRRKYVLRAEVLGLLRPVAPRPPAQPRSPSIDRETAEAERHLAAWGLKFDPKKIAR